MSILKVDFFSLYQSQFVDELNLSVNDENALEKGLNVNGKKKNEIIALLSNE